MNKIKLKLTSYHIRFLASFLEGLIQYEEPLDGLQLEWAVACELYNRHLRNWMLVKPKQMTLTLAEGIALFRLLMEARLPDGSPDIIRNEIIGNIEKATPWRIKAA